MQGHCDGRRQAVSVQQPGHADGEQRLQTHQWRKSKKDSRRDTHRHRAR